MNNLPGATSATRPPRHAARLPGLQYQGAPTPLLLPPDHVSSMSCWEQASRPGRGTLALGKPLLRATPGGRARVGGVGLVARVGGVGLVARVGVVGLVARVGRVGLAGWRRCCACSCCLRQLPGGLVLPPPDLAAPSPQRTHDAPQ